MKRCLKCGTEKPLTEFYVKDPATHRLSGSCKECHKAGVKAYQASKPGYYREIDKKRAMSAHRVQAREQWEMDHPERRLASRVVQNAVKRGRLVKCPCAICGESAEAHHPDYSAPLDVVWLCRPHHKQAHAIARPE